MANTCGTCSFKVGFGKDSFCRAHAPAVHPVFGMTPKGPQLMGQVSLFPRVDPTWWCGEYRGGEAMSVVSAGNETTQ